MADTVSQWTQAALPYPPHIYNRSPYPLLDAFAAMTRKGSNGGKFRQQRLNAQDKSIEQSQGHQKVATSAQPHQHGNSVSRSNIYASVESWMSYSSDNNTILQQVAAQPSVSRNIPSSQLIQQNSPARTPQLLKANAPEFSPAQSRYNFRSRIDQANRPYSTGAHQKLIQSIEQNDSTSLPQHNRQLPIRGTRPRQNTPHRSSREASAPPLPEPKVDEMYLQRAMEPVRKLEAPRKLLVILDLNGTLLVRPKGVFHRGILRPGVEHFLDYLFQNHIVMVCTSTRMHNAQQMLNDLMTVEQRQQLVTVRARESFGLTKEQYDAKIQIYKNLEDIWLDPKVQNSALRMKYPWSQVNTVLIDDSIVKAKSQPHSLLQVPEFVLNKPKDNYTDQVMWEIEQVNIMKSIEDKLEVLKWTQNVTCQIRQWQTEEQAAPGVVDETVDQITKDPALTKAATGEEQYMTPDSMPQQPERFRSPTPITEEVFQDLLGMNISDEEEQGGVKISGKSSNDSLPSTGDAP